jgi:uncharacterized protein with GYD domain
MATYVCLFKMTDQGVRNIKDAPKRIDAFEAAVKANGGTLRDLFLVLGEYDTLAIFDLPSDEAAAKVALATGMLGNARTLTLRAFSRDEFRKMAASL